MTLNKEEIINRVIYLRKEMLGITGKKLSELSNVNLSTIKQWENGNVAFTTKTTIFKIAKCFNDAGVYVSEDWILTGKGATPKKYSDIDKIDFNFEEEELFRSRIKSLGLKCAIISIVEEKAMYPIVELGDRVGGPISTHNFDIHAGKFCIIGYNNGFEIFRQLQPKPDSPCGFELVALNPSLNIVPQTIEWVAPLARRWIY
jgi:transcriptional regulator with XRE-family HTH domain